MSDNLETDSLIDKILTYIQDEECPELEKIKDGYEKIFCPIQIYFHRPQTDEIVRKLFQRKQEIRKRYKINISKIYIDSQDLEILYMEE